MYEAANHDEGEDDDDNNNDLDEKGEAIDE
jgi:hypothetical protein